MSDNICENCKKIDPESNMCVIYSPEGQHLRQKQGYCPIPSFGGVYADWRDDKPKVIKRRVRIGQQKQR